MSWNESSIGDEGGREAEEKTGKWTIPGRRLPSQGWRVPSKGGEYYHREGEGVEVCKGGIVPQTAPRAGGGNTGPGTWEVEERRSCVSRPAGTLSLWGTSHDLRQINNNNK